MNTALELRQQVITARDKFNHGEIPVDDLYVACDLYREAIREYLKRTKKRIKVPSRSYLIRAL
jgi:hypothetical protein